LGKKAAGCGTGGVIMKRFSFAVLVIGALLMIGSTPAMSTDKDKKVQQAVVDIDTPTKLMNVILKGQYLFVHDEERMARGEACTYIYNYADDKRGELIVSFHCIPVEREKSNTFSMSVKMLSGVSLYELTEYKFAGDTEGHKVPAAK
jgi:hypothetical protein